MYRFSLSFSLHRSARGALACGLFLSFALFACIYELEAQTESQKFERRAQTRSNSIEQGLQNTAHALVALNQAFVITDDKVNQEQFYTATQPILGRFPYIDAFAFQRLIPKEGRSTFEARMRKTYPGFKIDDWSDGRRITAPEREYYRVIDFVEPKSRRAPVFGLNAASMSFMDEAIELANDTGRPAATGLYPLFRSGGSELGFRIFMAVYREGDLPERIIDRRKAVIGYTVAVLRADDLFEKILQSAAGALGNAGLDIRIYAADDADESKLAFRSTNPNPDNPRMRPAALFNGGLDPFTHQFVAAGRPWYVVIEALPSDFLPAHTVALLSLFLGLLLTAGATAYLHSAAARGRLIEELVTRRTDEIQRLNLRLNEDIKAREKVEKILARNQQRAREMADISSDWYWEQDEQHRFVNISTDVMGKDELPNFALPPGVLGARRWELPVDMDVSDWASHRATLEAHQPFRDFEFKMTMPGLPVVWISASGKPVFDEDGCFKGYRGTAKNITDRKRAEEALSQSRSDLRKLADHLNQVKEDERKRIARDIHDDLGQSLMALRIDVSISSNHPTLPAPVKTGLGAALDQIDTIIKAVRNIINDLRPAVLDLGLHAAVEWQAREFERRTGIACKVHIDHEEFALDDLRATALFRIVQEVLTNIKRHANASRVEIAVLRRDTTLELRIADDGVGFASEQRRKTNSFGLVGIEERIYMLGGSFSIKSDKGQGTAIALSVPLPADELPADTLAQNEAADAALL